MKYKVGDKVRVRSDLEIGKQYGNDIYFVSDMKCYKGEIVTIQEIVYRNKTYTIEEDCNIFGWYWTDEMFEGKVEDMDIEIKKMIDEKVEEFRKQLIEETKKLVEEQKQKADALPKVGDTYWFIESMGIVNSAIWSDSVVDKGNLAIGNIFKTKEEAEFALEKLKVIAELKKFAEPKDRKWDGNISHLYIEWYNGEYRKKGIQISSNVIFKRNEIYFESEEKALEAIESVGEERVKKYYLEVEE